MNNKDTLNKKAAFNKTAILGGTAGFLLSVFAPTLIAQEVQSALEEKKQARAAKLQQEQEALEVIEVTGVRSSLESALFTKRSANSIVDAISSDDISSLPALDLGEALQAIPGVQVNRESERRESKINLRGLPGGFVKVTANNQSFATPTRSSRPTGSSNPFGAFESGVFDGVTVIKTPTADKQAGGISGIVDKKLTKALSKGVKPRYRVSLGTRYEQLNDSFDEQFGFSGSQHLIKDKLAVAFKVAGSEQNFRRDSILTRKYDQLNSIVFPGLEDWKAEHGIAPEDIVRAPTEVRQLIESNSGYRISFTGNIEWKPTKNLKLGTNLLYSKRKMDDNKFEQVQVVAPVQAPANITRQVDNVRVTPTSEPFFAGFGDNGEKVYGVSATNLENASYIPGNRIFNMGEETQGIFVYAEYTNNDWVIDGLASTSKAESVFNQTGLDGRLLASNNKAPTGVNAEINTGAGNLDDFVLKIDNWEHLDLDQTFVPAVLRTGRTGYDSLSVSAPDSERDLRFYVLGAYDNPQREMNSFEFNAKHFIDFAPFGDDFMFESVKAGVRYQNELLENNVWSNSATGINVDNITNDMLLDNPIYTNSTDYFNGKLPGYNKPLEGWQTIDVDAAIPFLQYGLDLHEGAEIIPGTGFIAREHSYTGDNSNFANNFTADQTTYAAYLMTNFNGEVGDIFFSGNFGLRYVETQNELDGFSYEQEFVYIPQFDLDGNPLLDPDGNQMLERETEYEVKNEYIESDYNYLLPSFNLAADLTDDVVLRFAYSEGFVRPNLRAQNPSSTFVEELSRIQVNLPGSNVKPYEASMYDISLEWYNREGSAISVGVFQKDITGWFKRRDLCPVGEGAALQYGIEDTLYQVDREGGGFDCYSEALDNNGNPVNVDIREYYNSDLSIAVVGYEFVIQQKLDFLPYPWNGFGGQLNYSYVDNDAGGDDKLYGISTNSYNAIGYYENDGFSFRLAYNYRNGYESEGSNSFGGLDNKNTEARGQLDMSARYRLTRNLSISLRGYNLTDVIYKEYITDNPKAIGRINYDGRTYSASINYSF